MPLPDFSAVDSSLLITSQISANRPSPIGSSNPTPNTAQAAFNNPTPTNIPTATGSNAGRWLILGEADRIVGDSHGAARRIYYAGKMDNA